MDFLSIFSLIVLIILLIVGIAVFLWLGFMPGEIAKSRHHHQAEAIHICGWLGILTMGILLPLAYIWAYTKTEQK
ncbi:MAG: DUF3302 domain-containing protein [Gammaproteobacteria bacterium]|nr:DUF3302 domain-containing protein [Gammaproteobacteria bacterium]